MGKKFDFDLIVIGSGPAGSASAFSAKKAGLSVAIVENSLWGGSGVNSRDLPFCSATSFSNLFHDAKNGTRFGLSSKTLRFNYPVFKKWLRLSKTRSGANSKKAFENVGITCLKGIAHFLSPFELSVGEKTYSAERFIIASGSVLETGGIIGTESVKCLTPETALDLPRLPKSLTIIGGGSTGCEFAVFFASLGVKVQILELSSRLLPKEDEEVGTVLEKYLDEEFKTKTLTESRVISLANIGTDVEITYLRGSSEKKLKTDAVLLATGSRPALDLGLENAGVRFNKNGIIVDKHLKTSMKHIFACGDCLGGESSSERATAEGIMAVGNLINKTNLKMDYDSFPRVVKTNPEIISLGKTEAELKKQKEKYKKVFVPLSEISASNTSDFRVGFLKLIFNKKNILLGVTVMSKEAEALAGELALIIRLKIPLELVVSTPHVASSFSELIHLASEKALSQNKML